MKLDFRNLESIKRKMRSVNHVGGCAHVGRGLNEALNHLESRHRPHVSPLVVLLLGGAPQDDVLEALTRVNESSVGIFGVGYGEEAIEFLNKNWIPSFKVLSAEDYDGITTPFLSALVKYDCKDHSLCSGPIENGTVTCVLEERGHASEVCSIHCDDGFQLVGQETALCGDLNGDERMEWISPPGVCKKISCPGIKPFENTLMQCTKNNSFSSLCRFWCREGFHMIGISNLFCGDPSGKGVGQWNARPPMCIKALLCEPELSPPEHGFMTCTRNNSFGSECLFSCQPGYTLLGSGRVVCSDASANGQVAWESHPPVCGACTREFCGQDIILLLDGSGSINHDDFEFAKDWVIKVFQDMQGEIDNGGTRVGIIQYSGESSFLCSSGALNPKYSVDLELGAYYFRRVKEVVSGLHRLKGCTATGDAIRQGIKRFQALGRENIEKVLIILTDGRSNDDVVKPAKEAEEEGIKIIAVGIGSFNPDQLLAITGRFVGADSYDELSAVLEKVQDEIMSDYSEGHYGGGRCIRPNSGIYLLGFLAKMLMERLV